MKIDDSWYTYFKQSSQIGLLKKPWFLGSLWSISRFEKLSTTVYISATVQRDMETGFLGNQVST
jgi:hypothetical protein